MCPGAPAPASNPEHISAGDLVRVELEPDVFKAVQEGHGGWNELMLEVCVCVCERERVCVSARVCVCVCVCMHVHAYMHVGREGGRPMLCTENSPTLDSGGSSVFAFLYRLWGRLAPWWGSRTQETCV